MLPWQCFCQGALEQNFQFFVKNGLFLAQKVFILAFLVQIRNQRFINHPCAKFQSDWTKDKGSSNFDLEQYRKLLDDVIPHNDDVSKIIIDFERFRSRVPSGQVWW